MYDLGTIISNMILEPFVPMLQAKKGLKDRSIEAVLKKRSALTVQ